VAESSSKESETMYTVVRRYARASELADALLQKQQESTTCSVTSRDSRRTTCSGVIGAMSPPSRSAKKAGTDESIRRAAVWVRGNVTGAELRPPEIIEGEIILSF
jgi:hypothetical protein